MYVHDLQNIDTYCVTCTECIWLLFLLLGAHLDPDMMTFSSPWQDTNCLNLGILMLFVIIGQWARRQVVNVARGLQRGPRSLAIVLSLLLVTRFQLRPSHGSTFKEERFLFDVVIKLLA